MICPQCHEEFTPRDVHQQYCTPKCQNDHFNAKRRERTRAAHEPRLCAYCHEEFTPTDGRQIYCKRECQIKHNGKVLAARTKAKRHSRPPKICPVCHEKFIPMWNRKFCCDDCRKKYHAEKDKPKVKRKPPAAPKPKIKVFLNRCALCQKTFATTNPKQRYCSVEHVKEAYRRGKFKARSLKGG